MRFRISLRSFLALSVGMAILVGILGMELPSQICLNRLRQSGVSVSVISDAVAVESAYKADVPPLASSKFAVGIRNIPDSEVGQIAAELTRLPRIHSVSINDTAVEPVLQALIDRPSIHTLQIGGKRRLSPKEVDLLSRLRCISSLSVTGGVIDGDMLLEKLDTSSLENLRFESRISDAGIEKLVDAPSLVCLVIIGGDLSDVSNSGWKKISSMHRLRTLTLNHVTLTSDDVRCIADMDGLENLDLSYTNVADEDVFPLLSMKSLKKLYVYETNVTDYGHRLSRTVGDKLGK